MANHKSAEKRVRSSKKRNQRNLYWKSSIKTQEKKLKNLIKEKGKEQAEKALNAFFSLLDKAKKNSVIHEKTRNRKKASFSKKIHSLSN